MDPARLIEIQEATARRVLESGDEQALLRLAGELAGTMRQVVGDDELWRDLATNSATGDAGRELSQLLLVDWGALLPDIGRERMEEIEDDLVDAMFRASEEDSAAWGEVREYLGLLAGRLEQDAGVEQPPSEDRRWWRGVRDRVGFGVSALRRVKIASFVMGPVRGAGKKTVEHLGAALILGIPFGAPAVIVTAAIGGLGAATFDELRRCFREEKDGRAGQHLDVIFGDPALLPGAVGAMRRDLESVADIASEPEGSGAIGPAGRVGEVLVDYLRRLRVRAARAGARLAAAWPFVAAQLGEAGSREIERVTNVLLDFRRVLGAMTAAAEKLDMEGVIRLAGDARDAIDGFDASMRDFEMVLRDYGFGAPHPDR